MLRDVEIYLLNQIAVFCNQRSKPLAEFEFEMYAFHFNVHVYWRATA